jgi:hypothetical protein
MLNWLIVLILLVLLPIVPAVRAAAPLPAIVTAGIVVAAPRCRSMRADFDVATSFGRDTARNGRAEAEDRDRLAEGAGCAGGESAPRAGVVVIMSDLPVPGIAGRRESIP